MFSLTLLIVLLLLLWCLYIYYKYIIIIHNPYDNILWTYECSVNPICSIGTKNRGGRKSCSHLDDNLDDKFSCWSLARLLQVLTWHANLKMHLRLIEISFGEDKMIMTNSFQSSFRRHDYSFPFSFVMFQASSNALKCTAGS